ncbi:MAG: translation initiation factor IF-6 [Candidatus Aenigmatarchaeota archaeon]
MEQHLKQMEFNGNPNLGLFALATEKYCLAGAKGRALEILGVPVHVVETLQTPFVGIFVAGNSHGCIVSDMLDKNEIDELKKITRVLVLKTYHDAIGNLILMNDHGIILSPSLERHKEDIGRFFKIPCEVCTIATLNVAGSLGIATNKGCLLNPRVHESELKFIEHVLNVRADIGTVNFGSGYPGAGIIANSKGLVISEQCSGPEIQRIEEALQFITF